MQPRNALLFSVLLFSLGCDPLLEIEDDAGCLFDGCGDTGPAPSLESTEVCVSFDGAVVTLVDDGFGCPSAQKHVCFADQFMELQSTHVCCELGIFPSCALVEPPAECPAAMSKHVCDAAFF